MANVNFPQGFRSPALMAALLRKWMEGTNPAIERAAVQRGVGAAMPAENTFATGEAMDMASRIRSGEVGPAAQTPAAVGAYDRLAVILQQQFQELNDLMTSHPDMDPATAAAGQRKLGELADEISRYKLAARGMAHRTLGMSAVAPVGAGMGQQLRGLFDQESAARTATRQRAESTAAMEGLGGAAMLMDPVGSAMQAALMMPGQGGYAPPVMQPYKPPRNY